MAWLDPFNPAADSGSDRVVSLQPGDDVMETWQILALWTGFGAIFMMFTPTPAGRWRAIVLIILGGPLVWIIFVWKSLQMWIAGEI